MYICVIIAVRLLGVLWKQCFEIAIVLCSHDRYTCVIITDTPVLS